jgi:hypothetical protein
MIAVKLGYVGIGSGARTLNTYLPLSFKARVRPLRFLIREHQVSK